MNVVRNIFSAPGECLDILNDMKNKATSMCTDLEQFHPNTAKAVRFLALGTFVVGVIICIAHVLLTYGIGPHAAMFLLNKSIVSNIVMFSGIALVSVGGGYLYIDYEGNNIARLYAKKLRKDHNIPEGNKLVFKRVTNEELEKIQEEQPKQIPNVSIIYITP